MRITSKVAVAALPTSAIAANGELAGTYKLISSTRTMIDTGEVVDMWARVQRVLLPTGTMAAC